MRFCARVGGSQAARTHMRSMLVLHCICVCVGVHAPCVSVVYLGALVPVTQAYPGAAFECSVSSVSVTLLRGGPRVRGGIQKHEGGVNKLGGYFPAQFPKFGIGIFSEVHPNVISPELVQTSASLALLVLHLLMFLLRQQLLIWFH